MPAESISVRYGVALTACLVAVAARLALNPWLADDLPYLTIFGAVAIAVWVGGLAPSVCVATIGFAAANRLIGGHPGNAPIDTGAFASAFLGFWLSAGFIIAFGTAMHRARARLAAEVKQRTSAQASLLQVRDELHATLHSLGDGVIVVDPKGLVTGLNPVAETLTGWARDAAACQPLTAVFDIVNEDTGKAVENPALRAIASGAVVRHGGDTRLRSRDGQSRPIDACASPVRDADGKTRGAVLVFRDVSTARAQQRQASRLAAELAERESVLRAMYDGSSLAMGVVELVGDDILHLDDNPATCAIFGVPPGATRNRRASELGAAPGMVAMWIEHYLEAAQLGAACSFTYELQSPTGLTRHRATVMPLGTGDSGAPRFTYISEDVTAREAADLIVRQSADRARLALDVAQIGMWSWNPAKDIVEADQRTREICGLPANAALNLAQVMPRIHPDDAEAVSAALRRAAAPGSDGTYAIELRFVHEDGSVRWVISRGQMQRHTDNAGDDSPLMLGTLMDNTERKVAEHARMAADRRKTEFIATLSHELRTPLAPLRTAIAVLRLKPADGPSSDRLLATMERQIQLMVRLIDDLLDVSRIDNGVLELRFTNLELQDIVRSAWELSQPLLEERRHRVATEMPSQPIIVTADAVRLTQVLANLLNNAAKYTPPGGQIRVRLTARGEEATVTVEDDGIGIPSRMLGRVFDMFAQVDRSTPASTGGLGIGLAISQRLMHMHSGSLTAHSEGEGKGSRFVMSLPLAPQNRRTAGRQTGDAERAHDPSEGLPNAVKILVVDDNIDAAESLAEVLRLLGHDVTASYDGESALQLALVAQPDVVLLDLGLPTMNGYEIARRLRDSRSGKALRIVAVTGWAQPIDRERTAAAGFDRHLVKPVDVRLLHRLVVELTAKGAHVS